MISLARLEELIKQEFKNVPFHNLFLLSGIDHPGSSFGGTCSDKALNFLKNLEREGVPSRLCSGIINGKENHRLVQVTIEKRTYLIDIGNGWPSTKPFPTDIETEYSAYGFIFRSKIFHDVVHVYKSGKRGMNLMVSIPLAQKPEGDIYEDVGSRFLDLSVYPFRDSLRFAQVIGESFLFLKGNNLTKYYKNGQTETIPGLGISDIEEILIETFHFQFPDRFKQFPLYPECLKK